MAKIKSIVEIQGTVNGLTFYRGKEGALVRAKGGVSKKRIMNDPGFQRTRENLSEFAHAAKSGKLLRKSIATLLSKAQDGRVTSRLTQVMSKVKNLDLESLRGERMVAIGLQSDAGKKLLRGFNFNQRASMDSVLRMDPVVALLNGKVVFSDFDPLVHLALPGGATHVKFTCGISLVDFEQGTQQSVQSAPVLLEVQGIATTVTLEAATVPEGSGYLVLLLLVEFFQSVNGVLYPLRNQTHNSLVVLDVEGV